MVDGGYQGFLKWWISPSSLDALFHGKSENNMDDLAGE